MSVGLVKAKSEIRLSDIILKDFVDEVISDELIRSLEEQEQQEQNKNSKGNRR